MRCHEERLLDECHVGVSLMFPVIVWRQDRGGTKDRVMDRIVTRSSTEVSRDYHCD